MATIRLQQPEPFQFQNPDGWPKWKRRFEQFRVASGLATSSGPQQVPTLLYCLGPEAEDVLLSTEEGRKVYETVLKQFDDFFKVRVNQTLERAKFNNRSQKEGETADEYITALYSLAESCNYKELKEEMICDRLVVGIRDRTLSEKLQLDAGLTLESAKKKIRQQEAVRDQRRDLQLKVNLQALGGRKPPRRGGVHGQQPQSGKGKPQCTRCGKGPHSAGDLCPAKSAVCHKCNKKGHYSRFCFTKTTRNPPRTAGELSLDAAFLGTLGTGKQAVWTVDVTVKDKHVRFKVDTGAEVTAVSEETYHSLGKTPLDKSTRVIYGPARQKLDVLGQVKMQVTYKDCTSTQTLFVIRNLKTNLLGLPAIQALQIVQQLDAVEAQEQSINRGGSRKQLRVVLLWVWLPHP